MTVTPDWIAVDWGPSSPCIWAMGKNGTVLAEAVSPGVADGLPDREFEPVLLDMIGGWLTATPVDVIVCGIATGLRNTPPAMPRPVPCTPLYEVAPKASTLTDPRLRVHILPGLSQAKPADLMRGQETQIAGFLSGRPDFDGIVCVIGSHTIWAHISAGEVVSFRSFMTGELLALLSEHSVLRNNLSGEDTDREALLEAVSDIMSRPELLAARLLAIRAEAALANMPPAMARGRLSGLLIGAELAAARPYWLGQAVVVAGSADVATAYCDALAAQGVSAECADPLRLTLAGLFATRKKMTGAP